MSATFPKLPASLTFSASLCMDNATLCFATGYYAERCCTAVRPDVWERAYRSLRNVLAARDARGIPVPVGVDQLARYGLAAYDQRAS